MTYSSRQVKTASRDLVHPIRVYLNREKFKEVARKLEGGLSMVYQDSQGLDSHWPERNVRWCSKLTSCRMTALTEFGREVLP